MDLRAAGTLTLWIAAALCVVSAAFTSQAISTGFDRRASVLRLLGTTPLGRSGLLGGKSLATLGVEVMQWCVVGGVGLALGWRPEVAGLPSPAGPRTPTT